VEIWDKDLLTDDSLGFIEIPLADLAQGPIDTSFTVKPLIIGDYVTGSVSVECKFIELKPNPQVDAQINESSKCTQKKPIVSHIFSQFKRTWQTSSRI
jgi:hypothetical protein